MILQSAIIQLINDKLLADGYFLVGVEVRQANNIIVLIDSEVGVSIDYCAKISRLIEETFDRDKEDFALEVSSPGVGQPFKVLKQYQKHSGKEVKVLTKSKKNVVGILSDVTEKGFAIKEEKHVKIEGNKKKVIQVNEHRFDYEDITSVKEVIKF
ncbi:MAG: ribosome assembly cofactor RimP [Marinilabiliaceae bacterium]|nr:ribosome assembly cofactor RimP [Marinilabiliaceae bacterium]